MKLWLLKPIDESSGPWKQWYDKVFGFVVRADDEADAREFASLEAGDENPAPGRPDGSPWLDPSLTSCVELRARGGGDHGVVLRDFASA